MTVYARPGTADAIMSFQSRYDNWIGNEWVAPVKGQYFENPTPVTGQNFCDVARSTAEDIELLSTQHTRRHRPGARPLLPSAPSS